MHFYHFPLLVEFILLEYVDVDIASSQGCPILTVRSLPSLVLVLLVLLVLLLFLLRLLHLFFSPPIFCAASPLSIVAVPNPSGSPFSA